MRNLETVRCEKCHQLYAETPAHRAGYMDTCADCFYNEIEAPSLSQNKQ